MNNPSPPDARVQPAEPLFAVQGLSKSYGMNHKQVEALKDITFTVSHGELLSIVGASGAGKSTLLHILGALDHPTAGSILYRGKNLFSLSEIQLAEF